MKSKVWWILLFCPILFFIGGYFYYDKTPPATKIFTLYNKKFQLKSSENQRELYLINPYRCINKNKEVEKFYCFSHDYFTDISPQKIACFFYIKGLCSKAGFMAKIEGQYVKTKKVPITIEVNRKGKAILK